MAVFSYTASDPTGATAGGTITADTPRQARDLLRERGLAVQRVTESRAGATSSLFRRRRRIRGASHLLTTFARELSTLLGVGVPLLDALDTIARQHRGRFLAVLQMLRERVAAGSSLADAMKEHPDLFDEMAVNMTETGEDAGTLEFTLQRLAEFRERSQQLRGRVSTALIYPAVIAVLATAATVFLMTFVVPTILDQLLDQGRELPWATVVLKSISDFLIDYWWALLIVAGLIVAAFASALQTPRGRWAWDQFVLRLPYVGQLVAMQSVVRISVVLGTLLKGGTVFVRALQIAQRSTPNVVIRDALVRCERAVLAGGDVGEALRQTEVFPPLVVQVFSVGQATGQLEEMLERLARDYDAQVSSAASRVAAMVEPIMIIILALVVLFIVLATLLPILEVGNVLS
jgi:general secretion pathway protein F